MVQGRTHPMGSISLNTSDSDQFYEQLPPFSDFGDLADDSHYRPVPDHWWVFVTDVVNSSQAVRNGRYRDVNKLGAASVTTVQNLLGDVRFPFTFGGDGATVVLPEEYKPVVEENLAGLRKLARDNFELELRVGVIPIQDLYDDGARLEVAKYELAKGRHISFFRGGGVSLASDKIKRERERYTVDASPTIPMDLENLSCRWNPIPNRRGTVLSMLVKSRRDGNRSQEVYQSILGDLDEILEGGIAESNPINTSDMSYRSFGEALSDELRYHTSVFSISFVNRFFEIILAVLVFRLGINPGLVDTAGYLRDTRTHSDYRTFDDMLRFVVDCSPEEREEIQDVLESYRGEEDIFYGLHESDHSLMTCFVQDLQRGGHLHFLDGAEGGYTQAAVELKEQIQAEDSNAHTI